MGKIGEALGQSGVDVLEHGLNGLMDVGFNSWNTENQLDAQYKNWKRQFDAINEYNKPINQMSRFQEAGLNPNLIYGQSNASSATPSMGTPYGGSHSKINLMGPLEYQQYKTTKENARQAEFQADIAEEQAKREKIATDEANQKHITNVYNEQNAFRSAVAQGGLYYNPLFADEWNDRTGTYNFRLKEDYPVYDNYVGLGFGNSSPIVPVQYDNALLSNYMLGKLYKDNGMFAYNTHESAERRADTVNDAEEIQGLLDWSNIYHNFKKLEELYRLGLRNEKQGLNQDFRYNNRTFESMTQAAISGFKEAIAKNNLLTLMHAGGYLGNESLLLRFFGKKIGHSGFDDLYSFPNYLKIKGDALWNAISQMGVDVAGAYLSRGAHRPFKPFGTKTTHRKTGTGSYQSWTEYGDFEP